MKWAEQAGSLDPQDAGVRYNVACLLALEGATDRAKGRTGAGRSLAGVVSLVGERSWGYSPILQQRPPLTMCTFVSYEPGNASSPEAVTVSKRANW